MKYKIEIEVTTKKYLFVEANSEEEAESKAKEADFNTDDIWIKDPDYLHTSIASISRAEKPRYADGKHFSIIKNQETDKWRIYNFSPEFFSKDEYRFIKNEDRNLVEQYLEDEKTEIEVLECLNKKSYVWTKLSSDFLESYDVYKIYRLKENWKICLN